MRKKLQKITYCFKISDSPKQIAELSIN